MPLHRILHAGSCLLYTSRVPALKELFLSAADSAAIKEKAASVPGSETFLEMMDAYRKEYGFKAMYTHEFIYKMCIRDRPWI